MKAICDVHISYKLKKFLESKNWQVFHTNELYNKWNSTDNEISTFADENNVSFGALERANKGTLLIDEVSEIPFETQANVLRVLIDQKFKRINGNHDINVDVRIICSSSKDIKKEIENGWLISLKQLICSEVFALYWVPYLL